MKTLWQNLRYTFRVLRKNPSFTVVAVLSLALGIGANTAIFTLINALLLRDLPVRQPDRLVEVSLIRRDSKVPFSYGMFHELERGQRVFSGLIGVDLGYQSHADKMHNVEVNGVLSQNHLLWVTANFYSELGVAPYLGRLFAPDDAAPATTRRPRRLSSATSSGNVVWGARPTLWGSRFAWKDIRSPSWG
jgi:MacB-like periplasmic core domain